MAPFPPTASLQEAFTKKDADEIGKLADVLSQPQYNLQKGAAALRQLLAGPAPYELPSTDWLAAVPGQPCDMVIDTGSTLFTHLPDTSWNLLATSHRN